MLSGLGSCSRNLNTKFTLVNCLFGAVKLTKDAQFDKYGYCSYGIGSAARSNVSINGQWGKNVIIYGEDNSSSLLTNNRKNELEDELSWWIRLYSHNGGC